MQDTQKQVVTISFFAFLLFVLYQLMRTFSLFFEALFWAAVLSFTFYPVHKWFTRTSGERKSLAAALSTAAIFFIVFVPGFFIVKTLVSEGIDLFRQAKVFITQGNFQQMFLNLQQYAWYQNLQAEVGSSEFLQQHLSNLLLRLTQYLGNFTANQVADITKNLFVVGFNVLLTIVLLFFFFRNGRAMYEFIYGLTPMEGRDRKRLFEKIHNTFAGVIRGQILTGLIQGVIAGTIFFFLGFPASAFLGLITFFTSMVPVLGASAVWVVIMIYLFLIQQMQKAIILLILGVFVISMSDNILKPIFISGKTKIPVFLLFLGILGGIKTYGLPGIFLGPLLITILFVLIDIYRERYSLKEN
ncbi:MAG: AI-2E family transporter [Candidatus Omnitrophica bacterium]|nr:AI-2E family transporter [Candidatus Omnitrophota bacterium]